MLQLKFFNIILLAVLFSISFLIVPFAQAGGLVPCGGADEPACELCHLWQLFSNLINFALFNLAAPVAVFMIVVAGLVYLFSGGRDAQLQLAKKIILNVVIGIIIMMSAWLIVDTLIKTLASESTESGQILWAWNEFPDCSN